MGGGAFATTGGSHKEPCGRPADTPEGGEFWRFGAQAGSPFDGAQAGSSFDSWEPPEGLDSDSPVLWALGDRKDLCGAHVARRAPLVLITFCRLRLAVPSVGLFARSAPARAHPLAGPQPRNSAKGAFVRAACRGDPRLPGGLGRLAGRASAPGRQAGLSAPRVEKRGGCGGELHSTGPPLGRQLSRPVLISRGKPPFGKPSVRILHRRRSDPVVDSEIRTKVGIPVDREMT